MATKNELYAHRSNCHFLRDDSTPVSSRRVGKHYPSVRNFTNSRTVGENLKDWKQRIADGRNATTSLTGVRYVIQCKPCEETYVTPTGQMTKVVGTNNQIPLRTSISPLLQNQATAKAKQKFAQKVRRKLHTWQAGVSAGELRESVRMLASPTKRLRNQVDDLLSDMFRIRRQHSKLGRKPGSTLVERIIKNPASLRRAIADTWLEWSFGVKPTISDCQDAYMAFLKMSKGRRVDTLRFKATEFEERTYQVLDRTWTWPFVGGTSGATVVTETITERCEVTYRGAYVYRRPDGNFGIPELFGVDLSSVAPTSWELIPYSWLVDYFTDVGSAIDAMSIRLVEFGWSNVTVRNSATSVWAHPRPTPVFSTGGAWSEFWCPHQYITKGTYRSISRQAGLGELEWYIPQFQVPKSMTKQLNLAALLSSVLDLKR